MRKVALTINGMRFKTKELDDTFVDFVEESLHGANIDIHGDNSAEKMFVAYLKLAGKFHQSEREIEDILENIDF